MQNVYVAQGHFYIAANSPALGAGSFGTVLQATDTETGEQLAMKVEPVASRTPQVIYESRVLRTIHNASHPVEGFPLVRWVGRVSDTHLGFAMTMLGPSLEELFTFCGRRFSLKTVLQIGDQVLTRLQALHSRSFINRDLKPENMLVGLGPAAGVIHLVDFGLCKRFRDPRTLVHMPLREGKALTGTARYVSINVHRGLEPSRRDDLESLGYIMVYFLKGSLPWQGIRAAGKALKYQLIAGKKMGTSLEYLTRGLPDEFRVYLEYVRGLGFAEEPNYAFLHGLLRGLAERHGIDISGRVYDWNLRGPPPTSRFPPALSPRAAEAALRAPGQVVLLPPAAMAPPVLAPPQPPPPLSPQQPALGSFLAPPLQQQQQQQPAPSYATALQPGGGGTYAGAVHAEALLPAPPLPRPGGGLVSGSFLGAEGDGGVPLQSPLFAPVGGLAAPPPSRVANPFGTGASLPQQQQPPQQPAPVTRHPEAARAVAAVLASGTDGPYLTPKATAAADPTGGYFGRSVTGLTGGGGQGGGGLPAPPSPSLQPAVHQVSMRLRAASGAGGFGADCGGAVPATLPPLLPLPPDASTSPTPMHLLLHWPQGGLDSGGEGFKDAPGPMGPSGSWGGPGGAGPTPFGGNGLLGGGSGAAAGGGAGGGGEGFFSGFSGGSGGGGGRQHVQPQPAPRRHRKQQWAYQHMPPSDDATSVFAAATPFAPLLPPPDLRYSPSPDARRTGIDLALDMHVPLLGSGVSGAAHAPLVQSQQPHQALSLVPCPRLPPPPVIPPLDTSTPPSVDTHASSSTWSCCAPSSNPCALSTPPASLPSLVDDTASAAQLLTSSGLASSSSPPDSSSKVRFGARSLLGAPPIHEYSASSLHNTATTTTPTSHHSHVLTSHTAAAALPVPAPESLHHQPPLPAACTPSASAHTLLFFHHDVLALQHLPSSPQPSLHPPPTPPPTTARSSTPSSCPPQGSPESSPRKDFGEQHHPAAVAPFLPPPTLFQLVGAGGSWATATSGAGAPPPATRRVGAAAFLDLCDDGDDEEGVRGVVSSPPVCLPLPSSSSAVSRPPGVPPLLSHTPAFIAAYTAATDLSVDGGSPKVANNAEL